MQFSVSLIVFGRLGKSAALSLHSILDLNPKRICIVADSPGKRWIEETGFNSNNKIFCFHSADVSAAGKLDLESNQPYSHFGKERFIRLTAQKWVVISNSLSHPDVDFTVFSDLDVVWTAKSIEILMSEISNFEEFDIFAQNDPKKDLTSNPYFCTGIMVWQRCFENIESLKDLLALQLKDLNSGVLTPDEPIFNRYAKTQKHNGIGLLGRASFVIGNRFFHLCLKRGFRSEQIAAFHANYVVGEKAKYRRLQAISILTSGKFPYLLFSGELARYLLLKSRLRFFGS